MSEAKEGPVLGKCVLSIITYFDRVSTYRIPCVHLSYLIEFRFKMKQQQHDINFEEDSEKISESQMGFEPTTLRDLVGCSNHLSYWRLYGEQGPICGSRLEPHHAATQPSNDWHTRTH